MLAGASLRSFFFVLIVWPKLTHASENLSTLYCILASEVALRAQSSANKRSEVEDGAVKTPPDVDSDVHAF